MASLDNQLKTSVQKLGSEVVKAEAEITFATINGSTGATTSDTVGVLTLPAGAVVSQVLTRVKTAEGGAATCDVGIRGGTATQFDSNVDANAAGDNFSASPDYINDSGDEQILIITPDATLDAAVIQIIAVYSVSELTL